MVWFVTSLLIFPNKYLKKSVSDGPWKAAHNTATFIVGLVAEGSGNCLLKNH